jgi:hypothetical protein
MTILEGLFLAILGGLFVNFIWTYLGEPILFSLSFGYRRISGRYIMTYPDKPEWGLQPITIKQLGFRISGKSKVLNEEYHVYLQSSAVGI